MSYSKLIADYRKACGLSQRELAQRIDMTAVTVAAWEQGTKRPTILSRMALAEVLGIPRAEILPELEEEEQKREVITEPDLVALVRACRGIPHEQRRPMLRALTAAAIQAAEPIPAEEAPQQADAQ